MPGDARPVPWPRAIWAAVAVLAVLQGGGAAIERAFFPSAVRPLSHKLSELPMTLGHWSGTEVTLDSKTFAAVGADDQVARVYKNGGEAVLVHSAAFQSHDDWTPHRPEICYSGNGWELLDSRTVSLPNVPNFATIQTYQQSGQRVVALYWYQTDRGTYSDREGGRTLRRGQWGRRERSPVVKTLLQASDSDRAEGELIELAAKIYGFNCGL
jgi:hypothetical protein